jgi:hypothetical protein
MNLKPLLEVADRIEKHPETFDMANWCGTACCVAGHLVQAFDPDMYLGGVCNRAKEILQMDNREREHAFALFTPRRVSYTALSKHPKVPAMLRWMVENNTPDWEKAAHAFGIEKEVMH